MTNTGDYKLHAIHPEVTTGRLVRGAFWAVISTGLGQMLPFLVTLLMARLMTVSEYGQFTFLYSGAATVASVIGFSMGLIATRYVAACRLQDSTRAGQIITSSVNITAAIGLTLVCCVAPTAFFMRGGAAIGIVGGGMAVTTSAVLCAVVAVSAAQSGVLAGFQRFKDVASGNLIRLTAGLLLAGIAARKGGLVAPLSALVIAGVAGAGVNHMQILRCASEMKIPIQWTNFTGLPLRQFGVPAFLSYVTVAPVTWICQMFLVDKGGQFIEIALFNIGLQWRNIVAFVPSGLAQCSTPMMAGLVGVEDANDALRSVRTTSVAGSTAIGAIVALAVAAGAPMITSAYGAAYRSGAMVIAGGAVTGVLMAFNNALGASIAAEGRMWMGFLFNAAWALTVVILVRRFADRGALGITAAVLAAYLLHSCWQSAYVFRDAGRGGGLRRSSR